MLCKSIGGQEPMVCMSIGEGQEHMVCMSIGEGQEPICRSNTGRAGTHVICIRHYKVGRNLSHVSQ